MTACASMLLPLGSSTSSRSLGITARGDAGHKLVPTASTRALRDMATSQRQMVPNGHAASPPLRSTRGSSSSRSSLPAKDDGQTSSLLNRRGVRRDSRPLLVDTEHQEHAGRGLHIRQCKNFADFYELGKIVMPSCHRDMEVRFATKISSKAGKSHKYDFVVKVRRKPGSFTTQEEEMAWRQNTEMVLNLPDCSTIARIVEVLEDSAGYYVVMEKVDGLDLHETLHAMGPMSLDDIKAILRQLLHAVGELHANGCIHKDLKLENVMLDRTPSSRTSTPQTHSARTVGTVKLIDFDTVEDWSPKSPKATRVLGTDQYIAPEAYEGRYSPASDIFAIGVIAYRLLAGAFPFRDGIFDDKPGENWVGSPKMREIRDKLQAVRLDWQRPSLLAMGMQERGMAQRLISRMLAINELHRPSAREALSDPWLALPAPAPPQGGRAERRRSSLPAHMISGGGSMSSLSEATGASKTVTGGLTWASRAMP